MSEALSYSRTRGEFSVYWNDPENNQHCEKEFCGSEEAFETALSLTQRPAAKMGIITRVIITDGGDCCTFDWQSGKVVYPSKEELQKCEKS